MHQSDRARELTKVETALDKAIEHHTKANEANAALHLADRVLYSPLTVHLIEARESLRKITAHDPASGPEPAPDAPGTAGVDAGTGEAG